VSSTPIPQFFISFEYSNLLSLGGFCVGSNRFQFFPENITQINVLIGGKFCRKTKKDEPLGMMTAKFEI